MANEEARAFALEYRLKALDGELHRRFTDGVFGLQRALSRYRLIFPEYTDHSELHTLTVIDFCNRLLGEQVEKLNKDEIYALLMGCYFHDTGMGVSREDYVEFSQKIDFGDWFTQHPDAPADVQIRDFHNEYSGLYIRKYAPFFDFPSPAHEQAIVQISRGHRKMDLLDEAEYPLALPVPGGNTICLPYLAALLRLADEIDVTAARNPVLLYDVEAMTDEVQIAEHRRHKAVRGLKVSGEAFTLLIDAEADMAERIRRMADKMQRTLDTCRAAVNGRTPFVITQREIRIEAAADKSKTDTAPGRNQ